MIAGGEGDVFDGSSWKSIANLTVERHGSVLVDDSVLQPNSHYQVFLFPSIETKYVVGTYFSTGLYTPCTS
jgi:hypothetical protein